MSISSDSKVNSKSPLLTYCPFFILMSFALPFTLACIFSSLFFWIFPALTDTMSSLFFFTVIWVTLPSVTAPGFFIFAVTSYPNAPPPNWTGVWFIEVISPSYSVKYSLIKIEALSPIFILSISSWKKYDCAYAYSVSSIVPNFWFCSMLSPALMLKLFITPEILAYTFRLPWLLYSSFNWLLLSFSFSFILSASLLLLAVSDLRDIRIWSFCTISPSLTNTFSTLPSISDFIVLLSEGLILPLPDTEFDIIPFCTTYSIWVFVLASSFGLFFCVEITLYPPNNRIPKAPTAIAVFISLFFCIMCTPCIVNFLFKLNY